MPEDIVVAQCSPTMAGLKTGSLFTCRMKSKKEMMDCIRRLNARLVPRGVRLLLLKFYDSSALIYMYRPARLREDLSHPLAMRILAERGYPASGPGAMRQASDPAAGSGRLPARNRAVSRLSPGGRVRFH